MITEDFVDDRDLTEDTEPRPPLSNGIRHIVYRLMKHAQAYQEQDDHQRADKLAEKAKDFIDRGEAYYVHNTVTRVQLHDDQLKQTCATLCWTVQTWFRPDGSIDAPEPPKFSCTQCTKDFGPGDTYFYFNEFDKDGDDIPEDVDPDGTYCFDCMASIKVENAL